MAFLETPRFPEALSFHAQLGPGYDTDVVVLNSGIESRNQNWSQPRAVYDVSHAARLEADFQTLLAFFHAVKGRANGFRFKDWSDFQASSDQGVFAMITSTTFQMKKRYTTGALTQDRTISKPVSPVTVTGGTSVSIDYTTGIVTVASGTPTAWAGQFDVPCRFDIDQFKGEIVDKSGAQFIYSWQSIPIIEIRV